MTTRRAYLDHNATSPLRPESRAAMLAVLDEAGNASSVHREGRRAHAVLDEARDTLARALGVTPLMVTFTSGGSEANNLALRGAPVERLLVSAIEHPSVLETARATGLPFTVLPVGPDGVVTPAAVERALEEGIGTALVSVMLVNNETGVVQPVREIAEVARNHGALVHCDAVQALGKMAVNVPVLGVDLLTVSAHKLGGPVGAGALVAADGVALAPQITGGGQERYRRAGTENVAAIAGFAAAVKAAGELPREIKVLRDRLETVILATSDDAVVFGKDAPRTGHVCCFAVPGLAAETALISLDLGGVSVSSGSACSSGKVARSHVLSAMGVAPELTNGALRVSLGWNTCAADIDQFETAWAAIVARHNESAAA